jgi:serine/threonine protein kinase/Tfp pilus assembly protein PilF
MRDPGDSTRVQPDLVGTTSGESRPAEDRVGELAEAFLEQHRRGERPSVEEYVTAHPKLAGEIRRLFPALLVMEDLGPAASDLNGGIVATYGTAPERLGDYRILREVGRGGMGVVYEAEQESLGRRVALKVLVAHGLRHPRQLLRFHREARAAARLHHTNIVPVFGVGESAGQHYYVMQFIAGLGLDAVLEEIKLLRAPRPQPDDPSRSSVDPARAAAEVARSLMTGRFAAAPGRETSDEPPDLGQATPSAARVSSSSVVLPGQAGRPSASDSAGQYARSVALIGVQVAEALDYAHRQGILHRDVKPSNLLLDGRGTVWVADFGLAKAADSDDLTHTGDIVGTVRYMAPERFEGRCDARSDVYALGLTLYELLALRPAFDRSDRVELIHQVTHEEPPRLRAVDSTVPRDLETVVRKAIEREPNRRYADAAALAEDLHRFVEGRAIRARRTGALEHAWRWCRRNPAWAALVAAILALVGLSIGVALAAERRAGRAREAVAVMMEQIQGLLRQGLWDEARAVLRQAEERLEDTGAVDPRARLAQAQSDVDLSARLEDIRMDSGWRFWNRRGQRTVVHDYAAAFQRSELLASDGEAGAADRIRRSAIREQLVAALDDWALATPDDGLRARLLHLARRVDPDPAWRDRIRDPAVRGDRQALERLATEVRDSPEAVPPPQLLRTLAVWLREAGGHPEPLLRAAQQRRPGDFWLNFALASVLRDSSPAESVGFCRAALVTRPRSSRLYSCLALALRAQGKKGEALAAFRKAAELQPDGILPLCSLGQFLYELGRTDEALAALRKATGLVPRGADPSDYLGLGNALHVLGQTEEAIAAYRRALAIDPKDAWAQQGLAEALYRSRRFAEARGEARRWLDLLPAGDPQHTAARRLLEQCELLIALETRVSALLAGNAPRADAAEYRDLADYCQSDMRRYAAAVRLYADAFASRPMLADDRRNQDRYHAACAAALAAAGQGIDADPLGEPERASLRQRARDWLRADLEAWAKTLDAGHEQRVRAMEALRHWRADSDLAGIRDDEGLARMPPAEADAFRALWEAVDALLERTAAEHPDDVDLSAQLAAAQLNRGDLDADHGHLPRAADWYDRAATTARAALGRDPRHADARHHLADALCGQATALCLLGRPAEATAQVAELSGLDSSEHGHWNLAAALWAHVGDPGRYRRHCGAMLERFAGTTDPAIAERTAKACLLLPGDAAVLEEAARLVALALDKGGDRWDLRPYATFADALAEYRMGRFGAADRLLQEALSGEVTGWNLRIPAHLVRAMAQAGLGHLDEARAALATAIAIYRSDVAGPTGPRPGGGRHDRLICDVLRREAEGLFLDRDFPADPFAR